VCERRRLTFLTRGKASRMPLIKQLMRDDEVDSTFKPKEWRKIEDPFSMPRQETLDKRVKAERARQRLEISAEESLKEAERLEETEKRRKEKRKNKSDAKLRERTVRHGARHKAGFSSTRDRTEKREKFSNKPK